ncbi:NADH-quinone oxidoreductase subunit 7 [Tetrabaena socialis]|uniref:NADH-ubiquinone oxidoreductase chain 3 n=1 Tax=Tetrabaena socialis TaxID=47790 RepID=A0A2J8A308_9CHLO|nr:NADH-quinone oxidoreductase subunit 7 [Tetrabaena socialis]|eukprot:PNH06878.1 NADH-quinone oxidoreductase subunit 7 [Tetrabaena socialis]
MYLLFDIEIAYLFPYAMTHASVPMYWTMNLFLAILVAGFAYEWGMGALEWREALRAASLLVDASDALVA